MFLFIVPFAFFDQLALLLKKYHYEDWFIEKFGKYRDRGAKKVDTLSRNMKSKAKVLS